MLLSQGCDKGMWNNPYPESDATENALYTSFTERPKHLDPAISYNADEWIFINQIYEPPLQYHYLKRPYTLVPLIATQMPQIRYLDKNNVPLKENAAIQDIAYSVYTIHIQPGVMYQQHPAFVKKEGTDEFLYHALTKDDVKHKHSILDFEKTATRELVAEDYVYQIKRLADPTLNSPVLGLMENYVVDIKALSKTIKDKYATLGATPDELPFLDLRDIPFEGAKAIDKYTYEIKVLGKSPQFMYWLAMPFYAPMPWEAIAFYSQKVLLEKNISLDWYPVGTGPFTLSKNNPNLEMILEKNPTFHGETYPSEGEPGDEKLGLLKMAGKPIPFLDKIVFILEKESIPYWSKFLQGYYDQSGVSAENYDQVLNAGASGNMTLTKELVDKGIRLSTSVQPSSFYWGFNMTDDVVGGYSAKQKKLRQAISIAVDVEEYINIFLNGNGFAAQGPLPPSIFGYSDDLDAKNPYVYDINPKQNTVERKSLLEAKKLLKEAGFPEGRDPKTGQPLVLYYDAIVTSGPESQSQFSWFRKQFKKLGIELVVRATQYNRFQDKMHNGDFQIFFWGWNADYPDPENFFFLLYGKNSKIKIDGENASNYENPTFDALYEKMKSMDNTEERAQIISKMIKIAQEDAPWIWGFHPKIYALRQGWVAPFKPNAMSRNTLKYMAISPSLRDKQRKAWNSPILWPLLLIGLTGAVFCIPACIGYWRKVHQPLVLKKAKALKE
ncbi:MAG: ABC transporter substrate-binding protein [Proteobacteria bacterium]|nr:ABC transporter substrate-binding protein [Pseudomonadota bacterium]